MKVRIMTLHYGKQLLAIPGPSVIPDRVLNAMHQPSPNIYYGKLLDTASSIADDLKKVAHTQHSVAMYIANGHAAWEAALANTIKSGETVLVLGTGRFAIGWGEMAKALGIKIQTLDFGKHTDVDLNQVKETLVADKHHKIKAILVVQTDTSSSVRNDIEALGNLINEINHPALFMVDCMASLATEPFYMDEWHVDVMLAGCQKGLMVPAGMAFVFYNPKARKISEAKQDISSYWNWLPRSDSEPLYLRFCGTAPTHQIMGLREALDMIVHEEGIEAVWKRHQIFARAIWAAIDAWGTQGAITMNISDPAKRSFAVTSITTTNGYGAKIRDWCENVAGVTLGIGLGMAEPNTPEYGNYFRIGHMGHLSVPMIMGTLGAIDASLKANNIPHGDAALEAATKIIAAV